MAIERATLRHRDGSTTEVEADVRRDGAGRRAGTAGAVVVVALLISLPAYAFPGIHCLILIPWYGVAAGVAYYLMGRTAIVASVKGDCPKCNAAFETDEGGPLGNDALYIRCPECSEPLEFVDLQEH